MVFKKNLFSQFVNVNRKYISERETDKKVHNLKPAYRSEIDGLRAFSVLSVIFYHLFPDTIHGGFVGVDIFFVISGFLISSIIFSSLDCGDFSFVEFYDHRIRRIFPALAIVLSVSLYVSWNSLLGRDFLVFGRHVAAGAAFLQNFQLWKEAGYFDISSELKPLLHLWSLAIEEQFYIFFPFLIWILWRYRLNLFFIILILCILSLWRDVILTHTDGVQAFFAPQARFWELAAGALLAHFTQKKRASRHLTRINRILFNASIPSSSPSDVVSSTAIPSVLSLIGAGLLIYSILCLDRTMTYPGFHALLPTGGAVLILAAGPRGCVNHLFLSQRPLVFIGKISYPLYLWHWPLLSFSIIIKGFPPSSLERFEIFFASILLSTLTYLGLEKPIRSYRRQNYAISAGLALVMMGIGLLGYHDKIFERQYDEQTTKIMRAWDFSTYPDAQDLRFTTKYFLRGRPGLTTVGPESNRKILFMGDSHGQQYENTFGEFFRRQRQQDKRIYPEVMFKNSGEFPPEIPEGALQDPEIKTVVFSYFWALHYGSDHVNYRIRCCGTGLMGMVGRTSHGLFSNEQMRETSRQIKEIIQQVRSSGKTVYIVLDNPFGEELAPRGLLHRSFFGKIRYVPNSVSRRTFLERDEPMRSDLIDIAKETGSIVIDPVQYYCNAQNCPAVDEDGDPILKDYDHLSLAIVKNKVRYFDPLLEGLVDK